MDGGNLQSDTAPGSEFSGYHGVQWGDGPDQVVENSVGNRFRERADITEGVQIKLQRLAFHAPGFWRVADGDGGKIRLAGDRAKGCEFRSGKRDLVRSTGLGIGKGFQSGQGGVGGNGNSATKKT